jgi:hypothetical protein
VLAGNAVKVVAPADTALPTPDPAIRHNTAALGDILYTDYIFFFQIAGVVLLVAMIGAIVLTLRAPRPHVKRQNMAAQVARTPERPSKWSMSKPARGSEDHDHHHFPLSAVSALLFVIGVFGIFLNRKNVIVILMSVELILLSVNINFVAFSAHLQRPGRPGLRAVRADGRRRRGRHRARNPGRLLPQPRIDRGRRHEHDEGLTAPCITPLSFCR